MIKVLNKTEKSKLARKETKSDVVVYTAHQGTDSNAKLCRAQQLLEETKASIKVTKQGAEKHRAGFGFERKKYSWGLGRGEQAHLETLSGPKRKHKRPYTSPSG